MDKRLKIRSVETEDAADLIALFQNLDAETKFMLLEPGERTISIESQSRRLESFQKSNSETMLVAELDNSLVGFAVGIGGNFRRNRHSVSVVIGVLTAFHHRGIGTKLLEELIVWARHNAFRRMELTVMTHNAHAISLYKKLGFVVEGTKRRALKVDDNFVDEFYMAFLL